MTLPLTVSLVLIVLGMWAVGILFVHAGPHPNERPGGFRGGPKPPPDRAPTLPGVPQPPPRKVTMTMQTQTNPQEEGPTSPAEAQQRPIDPCPVFAVNQSEDGPRCLTWTTVEQTDDRLLREHCKGVARHGAYPGQQAFCCFHWLHPNGGPTTLPGRTCDHGEANQ